MKCPRCKSKKIKVYENNGKEYICLKCLDQWQITKKGVIIEL